MKESAKRTDMKKLRKTMKKSFISLKPNVIKRGFTEYKSNGEYIEITHSGNMGNTVKNSVNPNLVAMLLPTIQGIRDISVEFAEEGSSDYSYNFIAKIIHISH